MIIYYNKLLEYLQYPFVQYALIASILITISASLVGVPIVLKRMSFISTGLSNFAFCVTAVASMLALLNNYIVTLIVITLVTIYLMCYTKPDTIKDGDAKIAILSVSSLSLGYILINRFSNSGNVSADVCTTLFGSTTILTLSAIEVGYCLLLSIVVIAVFLMMYRSIFKVTFDYEFSIATNTKPNKVNVIIAVLTACTIFLSLKLVGALLVSALIILPVMAAMCLTSCYSRVIVYTIFIGSVNTVVGVLIAIVFGTPVGSTIVVIHTITYLLIKIVKNLRR